MKRILHFSQLSADERAWFLARVVTWCLVARCLVLAVGAGFDFPPPHEWRQTDTMGVAMRYFSRWFLEADRSWPWLPAALSTGHDLGIGPQEFPLLNLLGEPLFALGPLWGKVAACLGAGLLALGLELANLEREEAPWPRRRGDRPRSPRGFHFSMVLAEIHA